MSNVPTPLQQPNRADWLGWGLVALIGGSGPAAISFAIQEAPSAAIAGVRVWLAAIILTVYAVSTGRPMPGLGTSEGRHVWLYAAAAGFCGYALPFTLFPIAMQEVSSILAGIMMASVPVLTVVFAALFAGEPMTRRSLAGVIMGALGVMILMGPAAFDNVSGSLRGQLLLLIACLGYASMGIVMRRAPEFPARSFTAAMMVCAALMSTPWALSSGLEGITAKGWMAMIYLGVMPTGITAIAIVAVVRRAGAGFLSTSAYLAPVVATVLGMVLFGEPLLINQVIGLATILIGITLTRGAFAHFQKAIWPRIVVTAFPKRKTRSPER
ncbi:MAG: EamA family transporter [Pseudomonadota bacterium]